MDYSNFLENIGLVIQMFIDSFAIVVNYLISNYFFITVLGLSLFVSLFYLVFNLIISLTSSNMNKSISYKNLNSQMKPHHYYDSYENISMLRPHKVNKTNKLKAKKYKVEKMDLDWF